MSEEGAGLVSFLFFFFLVVDIKELLDRGRGGGSGGPLRDTDIVVLVQQKKT